MTTAHTLTMNESATPGRTNVPQPSAGPLTQEHRAEIALAQHRRKKINRAITVASFNAWTFAILSAISLPFSLMSISSLIGAVALAALAYNEFRGRRQLKVFDLLGPKTLGINQLAFCGLITLYCGYQIINALFGPGVYAKQMSSSPEMANMLEPIQDLMTTVTIAAYGLILFLGVSLQGATAWYYFSRTKWLSQYLEQTPNWIVELDRAC